MIDALSILPPRLPPPTLIPKLDHYAASPPTTIPHPPSPPSPHGHPSRMTHFPFPCGCQGRKYRVCAVARDDSAMCGGTAPGASSLGWYGDQHCTHFYVVAPKLMWRQPYDEPFGEVRVCCLEFITSIRAARKNSLDSIAHAGARARAARSSLTWVPAAQLEAVIGCEIEFTARAADVSCRANETCTDGADGSGNYAVEVSHHGELPTSPCPSGVPRFRF